MQRGSRLIPEQYVLRGGGADVAQAQSGWEGGSLLLESFSLRRYASALHLATEIKSRKLEMRPYDSSVIQHWNCVGFLHLGGKNGRRVVACLEWPPSPPGVAGTL